MSERSKRALLGSGILEISSSDISGISMAGEVFINPKNGTFAHFQCINQHLLQFHHQRRGHSRLDTVFLLLLLTMRSSSYVEILIALDVTCSLVIDEPVSEGKRESHLHVKGVQYQTLIDWLCCHRLRVRRLKAFPIRSPRSFISPSALKSASLQTYRLTLEYRFVSSCLYLASVKLFWLHGILSTAFWSGYNGM